MAPQMAPIAVREEGSRWRTCVAILGVECVDGMCVRVVRSHNQEAACRASLGSEERHTIATSRFGTGHAFHDGAARGGPAAATAALAARWYPCGSKRARRCASGVTLIHGSNRSNSSSGFTGRFSCA